MPVVEHLSTGSKNPPLVEGKLRLYSMRFCPFAGRVHLVLNAKKIPYDSVFINLLSKPEWYVKLIPTTKVPALIVDGADLYESLIISDFLDERYPEVQLYPSDPLKKAKDRILVESFSKIPAAMYKLYFATSVDQQMFDDLIKPLEQFDIELDSRGTKFFGGDHPGMIDYMIWPWFERMGMFPLLHGPEWKVPENKNPRLTAWQKLMIEDEAVKAHYLTPEQHAHHLKMRRDGTPDYLII